jgi:hypothetical protein
VSSVFRTVKYIHYTLHYVTTCTVVLDYASRETTIRYDSWDATEKTEENAKENVKLSR